MLVGAPPDDGPSVKTCKVRWLAAAPGNGGQCLVTLCCGLQLAAKERRSAIVLVGARRGRARCPAGQACRAVPSRSLGDAGDPTIRGARSSILAATLVRTNTNEQTNNEMAAAKSPAE
jgi:hypothetical protein